MASEKRYSNLELVTRVDAFPYYTRKPTAYKKHLQNFYYFMIIGYTNPFGYVHFNCIRANPWPPEYWTIDSDRRTHPLRAQPLLHLVQLRHAPHAPTLPPSRNPTVRHPLPLLRRAFPHRTPRDR